MTMGIQIYDFCCVQVRDRATISIEQLTGNAGGPAELAPKAGLPLKNLETALEEYLKGSMDAPFDLVGMPQKHGVYFCLRYLRFWNIVTEVKPPAAQALISSDTAVTAGTYI